MATSIAATKSRVAATGKRADLPVEGGPPVDDQGELNRRELLSLRAHIDVDLRPGPDHLGELVRRELLSVRAHLDTLTVGQARLQDRVDQIRGDVVSLLAGPRRLSQRCQGSKAGAQGEAAGGCASDEANDSEGNTWHPEQGAFLQTRLQDQALVSLVAGPRGDSEGGTGHPEQEAFLQEIFTKAETDEALEEQARGTRMVRMGSFHVSAGICDARRVLSLLDSWMAFIILVNALVIGISVDMEDEDEPVWTIMDVGFSVIFWVELSLKISLNGFFLHFCGASKKMECIMNFFDACLVIADTAQLAIGLIDPKAASSMEDGPSAKLFRVVRIFRLGRLMRLTQVSIVKDLVAMILGLAGGMQTLGWALILFLITIYVTALVFKESLGRKQHDAISKYFGDVPRAMFTVFRCSFGDCSTENGTPIFEHVAEGYGGFGSAIFCGYLFFVVIGLFNVISAIFVESTLSAAQRMHTSRKQDRLTDSGLWCTKITALMRLLVEASEKHKVEGKLSNHMKEVMAVDLDKGTIQALVNGEDPKARNLLTDLDIDPDDHRNLHDILDPDNSGTIGAVEFVSGVKGLRGEPRRSDVVSVQLMIRSLQEQATLIENNLGQVLHLLKQHGRHP